MTRKPRDHAVTEAPAELTASTVARLRPLYTEGERDAPSNRLHDYPNNGHVVAALERLIDIMLPGRMSPPHANAGTLEEFLAERIREAWLFLRPEIACALPFRWTAEYPRSEGVPPGTADLAEVDRILAAFFDALPGVRELVLTDIQAAYEGDPAALSFAVVKLAYPGLLAIASHRIAHGLERLDVPLVPRMMSEWIHSQTGVDINPGATIGPHFFIDHATGVVVGETTEIGRRVKIYQGVTLGAKSFPKDARGRPIKRIKRHPTVGDDVVIYANATILGGDTVIGEGSTIGGNVFLTSSVPPHSTVVATDRIETRPKHPPPEPSA